MSLCPCYGVVVLGVTGCSTLSFSLNYFMGISFELKDGITNPIPCACTWTGFELVPTCEGQCKLALSYLTGIKRANALPRGLLVCLFR